MRQLLRRALDQFWAIVESDSVRPFIWLYYIPFFLWGIYGSLSAYPIDLIDDSMGRVIYDVWVWTPIPATTAAMTGLWLRHGGTALEDMNRTLFREDWLGLYLQLGGHMCMFAVLLIYEITGIAGTHWSDGQPTISVFLVFSYTIGCGTLALQVWRKVRRGKELEGR
jgi:hypothetical protein